MASFQAQFAGKIIKSSDQHDAALICDETDQRHQIKVY